MTCFIFGDSRVLVSLPEMILMVADYVCIVFQIDSNFLNVSYCYISKVIRTYRNQTNSILKSILLNPTLKDISHTLFIVCYIVLKFQNYSYLCLYLLTLNEWNNLC